KNDFGKIGYGGPCPPPGPAHHYHFKLYALDKMVGLRPGATKQQILDAMKGHVLSQAELGGTYKRELPQEFRLRCQLRTSDIRQQRNNEVDSVHPSAGKAERRCGEADDDHVWFDRI